MTTPLSLGIVTSCHGYGRWLGDWSRSILSLTRKPAEVGIVTHGSETDRTAGVEAARALEAGGLKVHRVHHQARLDFGVARNEAVGLVSTEWVMHLDADDMLMAHALDDIARLAPGCDIVALGYERTGDLAAGPRQRVKLYKSSSGQGVLDNPTPCSGVSPFRRSFWERSPYRTDMVGGWDTALWLGFGHLGARILATDRPCFWYRQHAKSIFNTRRLDSWATSRTGAKLQSLRRGDHGVSIIVPRAADDTPDRVRAWEWLARRYAALYPDWQVVEGFSRRGAWSKAHAVHQALQTAHGAVLVIADSDCVVAGSVLREAVKQVEAGAPWVVPHGQVHRLTEAQTEAYLTTSVEADMPPPSSGLSRQPYAGLPGGGIVVVSRDGYDATGGIPSGFLGWGAEDEALAAVLDTLLGKHVRLGAPLVHLWHQPAEGRRARGTALYRSNRPLCAQYQRLAGNPAAMWEAVRQNSRSHPNPGFTAASRYATLAAQQENGRASLGGQFARRNLANLQGERMAGARDVTNAARREAIMAQRERNAAARAEQAQRMAQAFSPGGRKAARDTSENKMLDGAGTENKAAAETPSGVTVTHRAVGLSVAFASDAAALAAKKAGLTDAAFEGTEPAGAKGYTAAQVRTLGAKTA